jgi:hypothetical protein
MDMDEAKPVDAALPPSASMLALNAHLADFGPASSARRQLPARHEKGRAHLVACGPAACLPRPAGGF